MSLSFQTSLGRGRRRQLWVVDLRNNLEEPREAAAGRGCGAKQDKGFSVLAELRGTRTLAVAFAPCQVLGTDTEAKFLTAWLLTSHMDVTWDRRVMGGFGGKGIKTGSQPTFFFLIRKKKQHFYAVWNSAQALVKRNNLVLKSSASFHMTFWALTSSMTVKMRQRHEKRVQVFISNFLVPPECCFLH